MAIGLGGLGRCLLLLDPPAQQVAFQPSSSQCLPSLSPLSLRYRQRDLQDIHPKG